jgi:tRNA threonylcarbamoyladenosine modification (KEOPS) complex  Pcc1 subunit
MKVKTKLSLSSRDMLVAEAIYSSLEPDNIDFPHGISFEVTRSKGLIVFQIASEGDPQSFLSTLDDFLKSAHISLETLDQLESE